MTALRIMGRLLLVIVQIPLWPTALLGACLMDDGDGPDDVIWFPLAATGYLFLAVGFVLAVPFIALYMVVTGQRW